jgi:DeoR/GlpR family transcriptional regulator of sugar metabolism
MPIRSIYFKEPVKPNQRHEKILELLSEHRRISVEDLNQALGVSLETIRRDLGQLAERGLLRKIHGGAALVETSGEGLFQSRLRLQAPAKRRIARKAASYFHPGDALFIDNGTTTLAFAEELAGVDQVTIITNGTLIAAAIARRARGSLEHQKRIFLLGGSFSGDGLETLGPFAHEQIQRFHAEHVVLTVGAVDVAHGVTDYDLGEANVARAMIEQARTLTVLVDQSKFSRTALFEVCGLAAVDRLISDVLPEPDLLAALRESEVEVVVAD